MPDSTDSTVEEPGPRSGHLGVAWEVAVVSTFIVVIVAVIGVAICQIRRRKRRRQAAELDDAAPRSNKRKGRKTKSQIEVKDLETGQCEIVTDGMDSDEEVDGDGDEEQAPRQSKKEKSSRPKTSSRSKSKPSRPKKPSSLKKASDPPAEEYYFEHPSQKPPKYYWDQR